MHTEPQAKEFFRKETLYSLANIARTSAHRFIVRAINIATGEWNTFILDLSLNQIQKIIPQL